jgi:hypothetical protein
LHLHSLPLHCILQIVDLLGQLVLLFDELLIFLIDTNLFVFFYVADFVDTLESELKCYQRSRKGHNQGWTHLFFLLFFGGSE